MTRRKRRIVSDDSSQDEAVAEKRVRDGKNVFLILNSRDCSVIRNQHAPRWSLRMFVDFA